ncbi:MAG: HAMP domain-containing sensor histidine kinase [Myxococcota bacterium]|nr:HAMP domain-containing sensor histidine kinase [Myxococcota bacterium]
MVLQPSSRPPSNTRVKIARLELGALGGLELRAKTFWTGAGGIVMTIVMGCLIVALLVGWVLMWIRRIDTLSITMLVLGSAAFAVVLAGMFLLLNRLRAQARLRQAEAAFLTGMSHNLRTPISAIRAAAQALQGHELSAELRLRLAGAIVSETRRLALRVANVLEAGRLEVEPLRFAPEVVDFGALVERSLNGVEQVVLGRDGSIDFTNPGELWVHGDPGALNLVVDNLIDNAITYSESSPHLEVHLQVVDGLLWLGLSDNGIGFDPSSEELLFRRFSRVDTGHSGTGLGLALARAIAKGHGGQVHLTSRGLGEGALAELWLPLAEED